MVAKNFEQSRIDPNQPAHSRRRKSMPIEVRRKRELPQEEHCSPGLRFVEANFPSSSLDCGIGQIFERYPSEGYAELDSDMMLIVLQGYGIIGEEDGTTIELGPHDRVFVPAGTKYFWRHSGEEETLIFACNSPPFDKTKRKT